MLRLYHPVSGIEMEWHAPIPQIWWTFIDAMRVDFEDRKDDVTGYECTDCPAVAAAERRRSS